MTDPARPLSVRKQDTLRRLENDVDAWVADRLSRTVRRT